MIFEETKLKGLFVITPDVRADTRGSFAELYRADRFHEHGLDLQFVQQNVSRSTTGVLRGIHFQWDPPLGKLIRVAEGRAFAVAVDIRKKSATLGNFFSTELTADNGKQLYLPPGFGFGFCVLGDIAAVEYLYTAFYNAQGEANVLWNDADIGISWPIERPIVSARDASAPSLADWLARPESDRF